MPFRSSRSSRWIRLEVNAIEERRLIRWADGFERSVPSQLRWALRSILDGSGDVIDLDSPASPRSQELE